MVSFDPPLAYPPIVFNWGERDVWYLKTPNLESEFLKTLDDMIAKSDTPYVIFLERKELSHMRKIQRFIKNYKEQIFRNRPLENFPKFILAEYKIPLQHLKMSELLGDPA
jgi:hypothetical protein